MSSTFREAHSRFGRMVMSSAAFLHQVAYHEEAETPGINTTCLPLSEHNTNVPETYASTWFKCSPYSSLGLLLYGDASNQLMSAACTQTDCHLRQHHVKYHSQAYA